jgi:hypothetical protein
MSAWLSGLDVSRLLGGRGEKGISAALVEQIPLLSWDRSTRSCEPKEVL